MTEFWGGFIVGGGTIVGVLIILIALLRSGVGPRF